MVVHHAPPLPFLPSDVHGKMVVAVPFVWLGDPAKGEELIKPIREVTESHGEAIGMNPWVGGNQVSTLSTHTVLATTGSRTI